MNSLQEWLKFGWALLIAFPQLVRAFREVEAALRGEIKMKALKKGIENANQTGNTASLECALGNDELCSDSKVQSENMDGQPGARGDHEIPK